MESPPAHSSSKEIMMRRPVRGGMLRPVETLSQTRFWEVICRHRESFTLHWDPLPAEMKNVDKHQADSRSRIHEKDHRDYEFVLAEIQRFRNLSPQEQYKHLMEHPFDALNGLKLPNGGCVFLSRDAHRHLWRITERGLNLMGVAAERHRPEKVYEEVQRELVSLAFAGFELTAGNAHDVFDSAIRKLEATYSELTHYVPCSVVAHTVRDVFAIGPVTFVLREKFLKKHENAIRESVESWGADARDTILAQFTGFYTDFQWIASIAIPRCDPGVSRCRAEAGIQKALDVFKLIVGSGRAQHVKQAYDFTVPQRHFNLVSTAPGVFDISSGGKMHDAVVND
jgi:hypothetical protein